jgi:sensor domain CHASE-containing protein
LRTVEAVRLVRLSREPALVAAAAIIETGYSLLPPDGLLSGPMQ